MQEVISIVRVEDVRQVPIESQVSGYTIGYTAQVCVTVDGCRRWLDVGESYKPGALTAGTLDVAWEPEHPYAVGDYALVKHPQVPAVVLRKLTKDNVGESFFA